MKDWFFQNKLPNAKELFDLGLNPDQLAVCLRLSPTAIEEKNLASIITDTGGSGYCQGIEIFWEQPSLVFVSRTLDGGVKTQKGRVLPFKKHPKEMREGYRQALKDILFSKLLGRKLEKSPKLDYAHLDRKLFNAIVDDLGQLMDKLSQKNPDKTAENKIVTSYKKRIEVMCDLINWRIELDVNNSSGPDSSGYASTWKFKSRFLPSDIHAQYQRGPQATQ